MSDLTHFDDEGRARMVDVSAKPVTERSATAQGRVRMQQATLDRAIAGKAAKGDVITIAELAGIMGAKRTADLIPLCHSLALASVEVKVTVDRQLPGLDVVAVARTTGRTGVEMEALMAVSVSCLTIYDMLKAIDRGITIEAVELVAKSGGRSGEWRRTP